MSLNEHINALVWDQIFTIGERICVRTIPSCVANCHKSMESAHLNRRRDETDPAIDYWSVFACTVCTPTHCTMSQMALPRSTLTQISTHVCSLKTGDSHLILWAECRNKLRLVIWLWYVMTSIKDNLYINICQFCFHTVANPFYCLWTPYIFLFVIIMYLHQS